MTDQHRPGPECERHEAALGAFVDGDLGAETREALERHLSTCSRCRALADDLLEIRSLAGSLEPLEPSPELWTRIAAATTQDRPPSTASRQWMLGAAGLAAAAVIALLVGRPPAADTPRPSVSEVPDARVQVEQPYQDSIVNLERLVSDAPDEGGAVSDVLAAGLSTIDTAIAESRAVASIVPSSEIGDVAKTTPPSSGNARVEMLRDDEYLRVWVNQGGTHYFLHLVVG